MRYTQKQSLFVFVALSLICLCQSAIASQMPSWLNVYSNGTFKIDNTIYGKITFYDENWKPSYQSSSSQSALVRKGDTFSSELALTNGKKFKLEETVSAKNNTVSYKANLKSLSGEVKLQQVCLSLDLPVSSYTQKYIESDGTRIELPKNSGRVVLSSDKAKKIGIPLSQGLLEISSDEGLQYLLQDNRNFKGSSFTLRIFFNPYKNAITDTSLGFALNLKPLENAEVKAETADVSIEKHTWEHTPVIILKLDDLVRGTHYMDQCVDYLIEQKVPASFGIIGYSLENPNDRFIKLVDRMKKSGLFEFWNHGYMNRSPKDKLGEFEVDSVEKQKESLLKTINLAKEKFGIEMTVFGPHWSGTNAATEEALVQIPQIKAVFYYTKKNSKRDWFVFERRFVLEEPIFTPNLANIKKRFENGDWKRPYLALQGHPDQWGRKPDSFDEFKRIVQYFKNQGCVFMTATQYLDSLKKDK